MQHQNYNTMSMDKYFSRCDLMHAKSQVYCKALNFHGSFNIANFANFQPLMKTFQQNFSTCGMQGVCAVNSQNYFNEIFKSCYLRKFSAILYVYQPFSTPSSSYLSLLDSSVQNDTMTFVKCPRISRWLYLCTF